MSIYDPSGFGPRRVLTHLRAQAGLYRLPLGEAGLGDYELKYTTGEL